MSIDGVIHSAEATDDGLRIYLRPREKGGVAGQRSLCITNWPAGANPSGLIGTEIWGGSCEIMVGDTLWAERRGYGQIILVHKLGGSIGPPPDRVSREAEE